MQTRIFPTKFDIGSYLRDFDLFPYNGVKKRTQVQVVVIDGHKFTRSVNEFWTAKQRQAAPLHDVTYHACFKPQLPRFYIELLTSPHDVVYNPFRGRGTTMIEAALLGSVIADDINPISRILSLPRLFVPKLDLLEKRLARIPVEENAPAEIDPAMFYHPKTLQEIVSLRQYLLGKSGRGTEDRSDAWTRMVAPNRLTGHSSGFFSVYTLPPNQAVSTARQRKINQKRSPHSAKTKPSSSRNHANS